MDADRELERAEKLVEDAKKSETLEQCLGLLSAAIAIAEHHQAHERTLEWSTAYIWQANFSRRPDRAWPLITRCLALCDQHPDRLDPSEILWCYKWLASAIPAYAAIKREHLVFVLDDLDRRYAAAGSNRRAVHKLRSQHAMRCGERDAALLHFDAWQRCRADDSSDCPACDQHHIVEHQTFLDDGEAAFEAAQPILRGELECSELPHLTIPLILKPMVRACRLVDVIRMQDFGLELIAEEGDYLDATYGHVEFAALTGRFEVACKVLADFLPVIFEAGDTIASFETLRAAHLLMHALQRRGDGLPGPPPRSAPRTVVGAPDTLDRWVVAEAQRYAAALDERNGNGYYASRLATALDELDRDWPQA